MASYVAFLRAINVGGHTVTMERLRLAFESLGLQEVRTFIASGNVAFASPARSTAALQGKIAAKLARTLGFEVATFLRTPAQVRAVVAFRPFPEPAMRAAASYNIGFLADPVTAAARRRLMALRTEVDDFRIDGREVYWLCRVRQGESTFSNNLLEKTIGQRATFRGANTVIRIAEWCRLPATAGR
jgi:uncharacterized protein (DUF1697 family)